jgi:hypothetical protein
MRKILPVLFLLCAAVCAAQTDNTLYARNFPGSDVGTKITNAQAACGSNLAVPCIIVIDPSLAVWPHGTNPAKCSHCSWLDYRAGAPAAESAATSYVYAVPGTGTISAAYARLVANGNSSGTIFLPCGTYFDNFQPTTGVTVMGANQNCVGIEPLNKSLPALGIQILSYITGYSVASGGLATITAINNFAPGEAPIIIDGLTTTPGASCLNGGFATVLSATPTQFTIASSCAVTAFTADTGHAATENWNFELDNVSFDCPGASGCQDAIQLQGRVDIDWITDQRKIRHVSINPGFTNGIHIIGRCISCQVDDVVVNEATNDGFLADHATPGCLGTTATCNNSNGVGSKNAMEISYSTFENNGNYGVALIDGSGATSRFTLHANVIEHNGQTAANGSCASVFAENIVELSIKDGYFEADCTRTNSGTGSASIRITGKYSDSVDIENNLINITQSIPPVYTDATYLSGKFANNHCIGGTASVINALPAGDQNRGEAGGLFEWGQNSCSAPVSTQNSNGNAGVASEPLNLGFMQISRGTTADVTSQSLIQLYNGVTLKNITGGVLGRRITITNVYAASIIYNGASGAGSIRTTGGVNQSLPNGYYMDLVCATYSSGSCTWQQVTGIYAGVAGGTVTVSAGTQGANSCSTPATVTDTGLTTSGAFSRVVVSYSSNPASLTGWGAKGGMVFQAWPTAANTATWQVCNQTATSITYSAITFNLGAD